MPAITTKGLKEQRAKAIKELRELHTKLDADATNAELRTQFDAKEAEVRSFDDQIKRHERMDDLAGFDINLDDTDRDRSTVFSEDARHTCFLTYNSKTHIEFRLTKHKI